MKKFFRPYIFAGAALMLLFTLPVLAMEIKSKPVAVLELFTSQGCSSCPPADDILAKLAKDEKLITLAYHVDYWNYIGWEDTFSDKEHSDLQRRYAQKLGTERIYTPQLLINGTIDIVGSHKAEIEGAVDAAKLDVPVRFSIDGDMLSIDIPKSDIDVRQAAIWLVPYITEAKVSIERGENRGRSLPYSSIVKHRQVVGMWSPEKGTDLSIPIPQMMGDKVNALAVLVQERTQDGLPGRMLGAAAVIE